MELWFKVIIGCLPAAVIGLAFDDVLDAIFYNAPTVSVSLILYGILFTDKIDPKNPFKGKDNYRSI